MKQNPKKPDPLDIAAGKRLFEMRRLKGLTQSDLAKSVGVTFQQIQKYENGTNRMGVSVVTRLAGAMGVHPALIVSDEPFDGNTAQIANMSSNAVKMARIFMDCGKQEQNALLHIAANIKPAE